MRDSLLDFLIIQKLSEAKLDPLNWEINTYYINRLMYEKVKAKVDSLGYKGV